MAKDPDIDWWNPDPEKDNLQAAAENHRRRLSCGLCKRAKVAAGGKIGRVARVCPTCDPHTMSASAGL